MREKFDLGSFYVGELENAQKENDVCCNINCNKNIKICLFIKKSDNYICLENGEIYTKKDDKEMEPLSSLLPKTDFEYPNELSMDNAIDIFNEVYEDSNDNKYYYIDNNHNLNDFFVGELHLFCKRKSNDNKNVIIMSNQILEDKIKRSNAIYMGKEYFNDVSAEDNKIYTYKYHIYKGLFMRTKDGAVFLHDNQIYPNGSPSSIYRVHKVGYSFYTNGLPLDYKTNNISIRKALSLYKNLN